AGRVLPLGQGAGAFLRWTCSKPKDIQEERICPMNKLTSLAIAIAFGFAGSAFAADNNAGMSKDQYKAEKDKIEAQYKTDKASCDGMKANAKDICQAEAKGKENVAKAQLEEQYKPSAKN